MSYTSLHGIKKVNGHAWPPHECSKQPYVSFKITEHDGSEVVVFSSSVSELDLMIDHLSTLRQELADAQAKSE